MKTVLNSRKLRGGWIIVFLIVAAMSFGTSKAQWTLSGNNLYPSNTAYLVGVGTTTPLDKLHVANGGLLVTGTTGSTPISGAGTRLMWVPAKGAFRSGTVTGTQWDDANIGTASFAAGHDSRASGDYSTALGRGSVASAIDAIVIGNASTASQGASTAIGTWNNCNGTAAVVIGNISTASGVASNAIGYFTLASGNYATTLGSYARAAGPYSLAIGASVAADSSQSITIGNGINSGQPLLNNVSHSIMLGTNSNLPTLFIQKANGAGTTGSVGIGTTDIPSPYKLAVKGGIIAEEVRVELYANWPDYVFTPGHRLMSLGEVEEYIVAHGHLPNLPSATEVARDGINLGEMNVKLVEKVEELTLHMIHLEKMIKTLETENATLHGH